MHWKTNNNRQGQRQLNIRACLRVNLQLIKARAVSILLITSFWLKTNSTLEEGNHLNKLLINNCYPLFFPSHGLHCICVQWLQWRRKWSTKRKTPYHLDNKSPHVSRIFSAHSFETSPEPLSKGSSLSVKRGGGQSIFFKATIHDHTFLTI